MRSASLRSEKRILILAIAVLLGAALSAVIRVYPEAIAVTGGYGPPDSPWVNEWHYRTNWCSLADIVHEGFEYQPQVVDAVIIHRRNASWLFLYAGILPMSAALMWLLLRAVLVIARFWKHSIARIRRSKGRQIFCALAGLSLACHAIYLHHLAVGGMAKLGPLGHALHILGEFLEIVLLPLVMTNGLFLYGFNWLNRSLAAKTSPSIGFPVTGYCQFLGAYSYNGVLWESVCAVLLIGVWVTIVGLLSDGAARLYARCRAGASNKGGPE